MSEALTTTMLGLPSTTAVPPGKGRLTKEAFYRGMGLTSRLKRQFVEGIDSLTMIAVIRTKETGIPEGDRVREISVIEVQPKEDCLPLAVLEAFARFRDDNTRHSAKVLYIIPDGYGFKTAVFRNANVKAGNAEGRVYVSEHRTLNGSGVVLNGSNLDQVWDSLCAQTALNDATPSQVDRRIAIQERIIRLRKEQQRLEAAHARTRQITKRNELWQQLRAITTELDQLQGEQQ